MNDELIEILADEVCSRHERTIAEYEEFGMVAAVEWTSS